MRSESLQEYRLIRDEMKAVKDCMNSYIGYVLGGSGAAVFGLTALASVRVNYAAMAYTALMMSLLVSMVLLVIIYKFYSHNRYAGYCKLLSQELFLSQEDGQGADLFTWEICVQRLRAAETSPKLLLDWASEGKTAEPEESGLQWIIMQYVGDPTGAPRHRAAPVDKWRFWRGLRRLVLALCGRSRTNSWGFPPFVVAVFFVVCTGFWAFGGYSGVMALQDFMDSPANNGALAFVVATVCVAQCLLWFRFCGRLEALMEGSATVEAFFWKFLPIRMDCLMAEKITATYVDTNRRIQELRQAAQMPTSKRASM
jgi:DNA polymerase elongation subunit (family B)